MLSNFFYLSMLEKVYKWTDLKDFIWEGIVSYTKFGEHSKRVDANGVRGILRFPFPRSLARMLGGAAETVVTAQPPKPLAQVQCCLTVQTPSPKFNVEARHASSSFAWVRCAHLCGTATINARHPQHWTSGRGFSRCCCFATANQHWTRAWGFHGCAVTTISAAPPTILAMRFKMKTAIFLAQR